jgi:hypothetical protein
MRLRRNIAMCDAVSCEYLFDNWIGEAVRSTILLTLAILVLAESADAQREPSPTRDRQAMEAKLLTQIGPQTRTWIKQEAAREDASNTTSETTAVRAVASFPYGRLRNSDIMALVFLVLMESAKSAREDLKEIMARVKAINNAKAPYLQLQSTNRATVRSKEHLDSLDRIASMESLRLQMAMDRQAKLESMLSNVMKQLSSTAASITQNLK